MPYVYSETNEWSKDWLSKGMSAALVCNNFSPIPLKISFHIEKSDLSLQEIYKALKPFWLYKWVRVSRVVARFPQASGSLPAATAADLDTPCQTVFVLAGPTCAWVLPQKLGHWFCNQHFLLSSDIFQTESCAK